MPDAADPDDEGLLDEIAQAAARLARRFEARALEAEDIDEAAKASREFQRSARTLRQCLALKARLRREARRAVAEDRAVDADEVRAQIARRRGLVMLRMTRAIDELDSDEDRDLAEARLDDLRERLDDAVLDESFLDLSFDELIARLHLTLGMAPPRRPAADDPFDPFDDDPEDGDPGEDDPDDPAARGAAPPRPPSGPPPAAARFESSA